METDKLEPVHPGEVLREEFLEPMGLTQEQLARDIHIGTTVVNAIVQQQQPVTADIALRLARYFKMSPQFWLGLQMDYDLDIAEAELQDRLEKEVVVFSPV